MPIRCQFRDCKALLSMCSSWSSAVSSTGPLPLNFLPFMGIHLRATERHLPYKITQCYLLYPTQVNAPRHNPSQPGRYSEVTEVSTLLAPAGVWNALPDELTSSQMTCLAELFFFRNYTQISSSDFSCCTG